MPETIISHLAAQADAKTSQVDALENVSTQSAVDCIGGRTRGEGMVWLRVNQIIKQEVAYEIMAILKHDD